MYAVKSHKNWSKQYNNLLKTVEVFCFLEGSEPLCINAAMNKALSSSGDNFVFSGIKIILVQIKIKALLKAPKDMVVPNFL